jgi:uncharacterized damage-inducible protein DinB
MDLSILQKDYANFNYWANQQMIHWLSQKPEALFEQTVASSFASLRLTILHIWDAELAWLDRLQNNQQSFDTYPTATFKGTNAELMAGFLANSAVLRDYVQGFTKKRFTEKCNYQSPDKKLNSQTVAEILQHVLQHSTYHRGQLVTIARGLGITDPPKSDFIYYVRLKK